MEELIRKMQFNIMLKFRPTMLDLLIIAMIYPSICEQTVIFSFAGKVIAFNLENLRCYILKFHVRTFTFIILIFKKFKFDQKP
ncbi:hypothetical protein T06_14446 [Trichinella sp. T6]|nr:hypothetical protein T06_14446 [Trichinella sp. T6]